MIRDVISWGVLAWQEQHNPTTPLLPAEQQARQAPAGRRAESNSTEGFKGIFLTFELQGLFISFLKNITLIKMGFISKDWQGGCQGQNHCHNPAQQTGILTGGIIHKSCGGPYQPHPQVQGDFRFRDISKPQTRGGTRFSSESSVLSVLFISVSWSENCSDPLMSV